MTTITCPKCGTVNVVSAMNCRTCRVNLKFALEHTGEIDRLEEMKHEDKQKEMHMGIVRLNIERSKEVTWPDRCPACDGPFGGEAKTTFALKGKKKIKVWLWLCSQCSKRVRRAEIVSNCGYGFAGLVFLQQAVGSIHPGAAAAFWVGAIIGWLGNKKKKSIIGVRIIEASPQALTLCFKNKGFASDFLSANEGTLPEKHDKEVHAEKEKYQKQVQEKERVEQTRMLGRKISIHRGVGITFVGVGGFVLLILFLISLSVISKGGKIGAMFFFIIVICIPLITSGIIHFRRARRLRKGLGEMQRIGE